MKAPLVYTERYTLAWPGHVFPTRKYEQVARAVREEGLAEEFHEPRPAASEEILTCHRPEYLERLRAIADGLEEWDPRFECPVSRPVLESFGLAVGGTILAGRLAVERGYAANLGGGFHHAYPDHGEGFCLLNDVAVAARVLLGEGLVRRVLVADLDVHQGNGTAVMAREDPRIFTLSVHQENNYPVKEISDLDVGLPDLADDDVYLGAVDGALRRAERAFSPDLVLYLAGADPYVEDRLGGLAVSKRGLEERDRIVFDHAERSGAAVAALLAGGYPRRERDVVEIHLAMIRELLRRAGRNGRGREEAGCRASPERGGAPGDQV